MEGQLAQLAALRQGQAPPRIPPQCPNAGPYPTHLILTQVQGNVQFVRVFFAVFPMFFEGKRMSNSSQLSIFYWEISLSQQNLVLSKVCSFCKVLFVQRFHCVRSCFFFAVPPPPPRFVASPGGGYGQVGWGGGHFNPGAGISFGMDCLVLQLSSGRGGKMKENAHFNQDPKLQGCPSTGPPEL